MLGQRSTDPPSPARQRKHPLAIAYIVMALTVAFSLAWGHHIDQIDARRVAEQVSAEGKAAAANLAVNTAQARVAGCEQDNLKALQQRDAERKEIRLFVSTLTAGSKDPTVPDRVVLFYRHYDALIVSSHKLRDCTPAGIAKFLSPKP